MPTPPLSDADVDKTQKAVDKTRNPDGSVNISAAARLIGIRRSTMQHRLKLYPALARRRFTAPKLPSASRNIDDLVKYKLEQSKRSKDADKARDLIEIPVHIRGPFGLLIFGDPHVDADGCDFQALMAHRQIAIDHSDYILAGSVGDHSNNWVGRLARCYADQGTTASEAWRLVEWLISPIHWLFIIAGNHDLWSGHGDPLEWISRQAESIYEPYGVRMELQHPNGTKTRLTVRHDMPGRSIYHHLHGPKREVFFGNRDDLIVAGHLHTGGSEQMVRPDGGVTQLVRVSGYKVVDHYATEIGVKKAQMHPAALIIIDERQPNTSAARVWCAPTVEIGVSYLTHLRREYEAEARANQKKRANSP